MPVVSLSYERLLRLVSGPGDITRGVISERLPHLGLDIESDDGDTVRIEYSPNRPDYATDVGVSLALQGMLGVKRGLVPFDVEKSPVPSCEVRVSQAVSGVRPVLTGVVARGGALDDHLLRQLVTLQEDLHFGLGRNRRKVAIGLHDLSKIEGGFPLVYTAVPADHEFAPLGEQAEMTVAQIMRHTKAGRAYGSLVADGGAFPAILDDGGNTVSLPPIINSDMTAVTPDTTDILVDVTGTSRHAAESVLAVMSVTLHAAGFGLEALSVAGGGNRTPPLEPRAVRVSVDRVNEVLGLDMSPGDVASCLERCRLQPQPLQGKGPHRYGKIISCTVPAYRQDIMSEVDLIEEAALGHGTWRIEPVPLPSGTFGNRSAVSRAMHGIDTAMIGMGYVEALNSSLTSAHILYEVTNRPVPERDGMIATVGSKSSEHAILRDSLLPGLIENLSRNIHEEYPQRLYETGTIFLRNHGAAPSAPTSAPVLEVTHVAAITAHKDSGFSEAKSVLRSMLGAAFGADVGTAPAPHHMFADGRCAGVIVEPAADGPARAVTTGYIGEIDPAILSSYRIRAPVSGFELSLSDSSLLPEQ